MNATERGSAVRLFHRILVMCLVCMWPALSNAAEQLKLAEISSYLNGLSTLKTDFRQINDDGSISTGVLYISRPGKMRFEYDPPEQALVLASASAVYIIDRKSNLPPETYPLRRTPLSLILSRNIDLTRAKLVRDARFDGTSTIVTVVDPDNSDSGTLEMSFTDSPIRLEQWVIYDASGGRTTVILGEYETGMSLPNALFDPDRERKRNDR